MTTKFGWLLRQLLKRIWVRVVGFAVLAVVTAMLAQVLAPVVPAALAARIGAESVAQVLGILASSMLAVTTFSLSIAVSAFAAAASTATPRATALLQEDRTTQNVLATFLGAFLFSLLSLIALQTDLYDTSGRVVLFLATVAVVILVVVGLLRWITHLMTFGRMGNTLDRVEAATARSLERRLANPYLGGNPLRTTVPEGAAAVRAVSAGYVQHVDVDALSDCAGAMQARIYVASLPGRFVHEAATLVHVDGVEPDEKNVERLRDAFSLGNERLYDEDPRFGLIVLAEIASRALSPGFNDPGTAISVIGRLVRVLSAWTERAEPEIASPDVYVPAIRPKDMIEDAFHPIARDGAALVEVQIRLMKALDALCRIAPAVFGRIAADMAAQALAHARDAGLTANELAAIEAAAPKISASDATGAPQRPAGV